MIRVAIADDHTLFADGLADALGMIPDMRVVCTAHTAEALRAELASQPADVVLADLEMPGGGGQSLLGRGGLKVPVVIVSMHVTPQTTDDALSSGAFGVMSKSTPLATLAAAVRAVAAGKRLPADPAQSEALLADFAKPTLDPGAASLTERETELLALLANGVSSTEEIATRLYISQKTVKNHLASIFQKLSVSDRTQAAVEAIRLGLGSHRN